VIDSVAIGIDLGGTNCRAGLVGPAGLIGQIVRIPTRKDVAYPFFLQEVNALCAQLFAAAKTRGLKVVRVGMGAPGIVGVDGTVLTSPNLPMLNGQSLAVDLERSLRLPVVVMNDANAICWGEALYGAGMHFSSFITLTLGTGVGGGLVLDRRIWPGADGAAGEVGHITVVPDGRPCGCGNRGCLEQYASASALVLGVRERLAAGQASSLLSPPSELTSYLVAAAARAGDPLALSVIDEAGRALGLVLAGVANLLNLEGAVISGGASESFDLLQPVLLAELHRRAFGVPARRLQVVCGQLGDEAGILGAAGLAFGSLTLMKSTVITGEQEW
jgi:glucokinase